jgi:hypothetical protein
LGAKHQFWIGKSDLKRINLTIPVIGVGEHNFWNDESEPIPNTLFHPREDNRASELYYNWTLWELGH